MGVCGGLLVGGFGIGRSIFTLSLLVVGYDPKVANSTG
jgi:uncharacterized membrane protein YfcA